MWMDLYLPGKQNSLWWSFLSFYLQINIVRYLFVSGVRVITAWKTNCDLKSINFYQTDVFLILYALEINLIISIL